MSKDSERACTTKHEFGNTLKQVLDENIEVDKVEKDMEAASNIRRNQKLGKRYYDRKI